MKKLYISIFLLSLSSIIRAQDSKIQVSSAEKVKFDVYFGAGALFNSDYKLNQKLVDANMPEIKNVVPELSVGLNAEWLNWSADLELTTSYFKKDNNPLRSEALSTGLKLRGHYAAYKTQKFLFSAGVDLTYHVNYINLYNRDAHIDLNNLNPTTQIGSIRLTNEMFYVGPSVAVGLFQHRTTKLRLNAGYEIAAISSRWKSDYTVVNNTFRENGHDRFYLKLVIM